MKVSVIVPVYRVEKYIEQCACSLFEQTFSSIEYLFIDDFSDDKSIEILNNVIERYPQRKNDVKIIRHSKNQGLAAARKTGIVNAEGEYLIHVDSDDWLELNAIELLYNKALQEDADIVVYNLKHIYKDSIIIEDNTIGENKQSYLNKILLRETSVNLVTKLFKSELCKKNDVLPIEGLNYSEDFVVLARIVFYANKIVKLNETLYNYNHLNESSYTNTVKRNSIANLQQTINVLESFFSSKKDSELNVVLKKFRIVNNNIIICVCEKRDLEYVLKNVLNVELSILFSLPIKHLLLYVFSTIRFYPGIKLYRYLRNKKYNL